MEEREVRLKKLEELKSLGEDPYKTRFERTHSLKEIKDNYPSLEGKVVKVAGRVISKRLHGKASFSTIRDFSGTLQIYIRFDNVGEETYKFFKKFIDPGDFIGVEGEVFKTHTGEITINVRKLTLLSKSIRPLPEKYHGVKDVEVRYRKRYLDLIANPEVKEIFITRSKLIKTMREILESFGFIEVETPMLQPIPGGATARPFVTYHNALDMNLYLRIAPELYLKRLIVGGFERIFEINRNFRNEGISTVHNPEFTMLELYWAYADYKDMMELTEKLISETVKRIKGSYICEFKGEKIDFSPPW
ncbi:MAG TPA: lysine--tRNA ligase, partial [Firmicutes bacterium]|nr:lysine--tRNA ligase [Bacillota bacterium]